MHVAVAAICLIAIIGLIKWFDLGRQPTAAATVRSWRRFWILPFASRIHYVSRPIKFAFICLDVVNAIVVLGFILVLLWVLLMGSIRPVHEWFR